MKIGDKIRHEFGRVIAHRQILHIIPKDTVPFFIHLERFFGPRNSRNEQLYFHTLNPRPYHRIIINDTRHLGDNFRIIDIIPSQINAKDELCLSYNEKFSFID